MAFNQGCKGLIPKDKLYYYFLYHYLAYKVDLLNSLGTGATFKELSASKLKEVEIPLPPLSEQKRIVAILDEAFAFIDKAKANAEKNLRNANSVFECGLDNILYDKKWEIKELGEVCTNVEYGSSKKSTTHGKLPVLRMGNIQKSRFTWNDLVFSDNEEDNKHTQA